MKRRSFLKSLFSAFVAAAVARQLTAEEPEFPESLGFEKVLYEGFRFEIDPHPMRFMYQDGEWKIVTDEELTAKLHVNPEWVRAEHNDVIVELVYHPDAFR
jgi:hypothetical protein